ncbi:hypothetical protein [Brevibacterium linens]|uniref:Uncharacterized protein n=1 Tax=Brevibacterium linens TaxID=1703 RepID=A0A2H1I585_BRELN|nr:hypothetical protein [Brevibacterium linens]SMX70358.1 hypothetical protein BLIN101_00857 [Brevibacterium linens]
MIRPLNAREHSVALRMIRSATPSPDEADFAAFTPEQRQGWNPPEPISNEQRQIWECRLGEVMVTSRCDCGTCPSIGMRPQNRLDDERRDDQGGDGDYSERVVLTAGSPGAMLLLFIDDDSPSYLELAPIDEGQSFTDFPEPETISF